MTDDEYYAEPTREELEETDFLKLGPIADDSLPLGESILRQPSEREMKYLEEMQALYRIFNPTQEQVHRLRVVTRWINLSMDGTPPMRPFSPEETANLKKILESIK